MLCPLQQQQWRLVPKNSWSPTGMSTLTQPLQHISGKDHNRRLRRSWRHCQHWRQNNHKPPLCWWHWWLSRRGRRTGKFSWASWQSLHSLRHRDQCREDQDDDKQHLWHQQEINVNGQKLETVTSYKYLGSVISDKSSKHERLSRIAQATAALTRLKPIWNDRSISLSSKIRLMRSLVTYIFVYSCESCPHSRAPKKNTSHGFEMLPKDTTYRIQRPCYQRESPYKDSAGNLTTWRPPDDRKETQTAVIWSCLPFIRSGQNHFARHSERGKRTRQTEEEVGKQHQGMDRPVVRQVPEGIGK